LLILPENRRDANGRSIESRAVMTDDRESLASENNCLRKARNRWRVVAIAALFFMFVGLLPTTVVFMRAITYRQTVQLRYLLDQNQKLETELKKTTAARKAGSP
jgi:Mg2+/citrate symporter